MKLPGSAVTAGVELELSSYVGTEAATRRRDALQQLLQTSQAQLRRMRDAARFVRLATVGEASVNPCPRALRCL